MFEDMLLAINSKDDLALSRDAFAAEFPQCDYLTNSSGVQGILPRRDTIVPTVSADEIIVTNSLVSIRFSLFWFCLRLYAC